MRGLSIQSVLRLCGCICLGIGLAVPVSGQEMHRIHTSGLPTGEVGQTRLAQGGPVRDYYQPVQFCGPEGAQISLAHDSRFTAAKPMPSKAGLLIGQVYRFRITGIPLHAGEAVFPTVELIDRTYPPFAQALDFPVVIEITQDDIETALNGKYITKVVYLENPQFALPAQSDPNSPLHWDIEPAADPLSVANTLGRPVAIVRIGGRAPSNNVAVDPTFFFGCPPWFDVEQNVQGQVRITHFISAPHIGTPHISTPRFPPPHPTPTAPYGVPVPIRQPFPVGLGSGFYR